MLGGKGWVRTGRMGAAWMLDTVAFGQQMAQEPCLSALGRAAGKIELGEEYNTARRAEQEAPQPTKLVPSSTAPS